MKLGDLAVGEKAKVAGYIKGPRAYREKLMAMGLTKGTDFVVTRVAPMGDPVEIKVRDFALTLRRDEAAAVTVERGD
jgi:ferrous iron transport protein A